MRRVCSELYWNEEGLFRGLWLNSRKLSMGVKNELKWDKWWGKDRVKLRYGEVKIEICGVVKDWVKVRYVVR
jgi:hypothetical protein